MDNLNNHKTMNADSIFGKRFLNSKSLYLYCFNALPSIHFMGNINGEKAYKAFKEKYASVIQSEHQIRCYDRKRKQYEFDHTIFILNNDSLAVFDEGWCELLHNGKIESWVSEFTRSMSAFKIRERRKPLEINLIVEGSYGLDLRSMEIKRTKLDLDLFYEDDFKAVDEVIQQRLRKKEDKGIVLLHGLPGTGKTTYLRYLIGRIKKRVLFVSPNMAKNLMNPGFIDLLIDNPNTVVVIEDAEHIIMDRRTSGGSSVSNLLNISDGLLADFLNVQLICTFNSSLTMIDSALLRKGRLIAKYEFGKLSIAKAQALSNHLGFDTIITKPVTIAEVANQHEKAQPVNHLEIAGFHKRELIEN
jgi:hypothetical protein